MKQISVDVQKKLMFIPMVNSLNILILYINLLNAKVSGLAMIKALFTVLAYGLPVWLVLTTVGRFVNGFTELFSIATIYLTPLVMSVGSIKYQERHL